MKVFGRISKIILITIFLFLSWSHLASASFEITEIMYDLDGTDTGREWVEVYNNGNESTDFSHWYFFSDNTKHSLVPQGNSSIPAGGYAVITQDSAKFRVDWPNYSGLLFDSSWTGLSNDGETIALKDPDLNIVSQVSFTSSQGGAGDGSSLQKINSSWGGATPTPGVQNQTSGGGGGGNGGGGSGGGVDTGTGGNSTNTDIRSNTKKEIEVTKITTNILAKNTTFAGLPLEIDFRTTGLRKEPIVSGRFAWNFGDGTSFSMSEQKKFEHIYLYPGDYVLSLSYYSNPFEKEPQATDRLILKVLSSEISISSVGDASDPYIELYNKSNYELDISHWVLRSYLKSFDIPTGTIILPNSKVKISSKLTGFDYEDVKYLTLEDITGKILNTYPNYKKSSMVSDYSEKANLNSKNRDSNIIDLNNISASAGNSITSISNKSMSIIGLALIILIGIITVLLVRKNHFSDEIDNNIKASDITIME
jgi:hypothetical protein